MYNPTPRLSLVVACAGLAVCSHAAADEPTLAPDAPIRARIGGYVYINARTGERTVSTLPSPTRNGRFPHFVNEDSTSNGYYFWGMDNPALSFPTTVGGGMRIGGEAANWGDIAFDTRIDAFTFGFANNHYPFSTAVPGLDMTLWWFNCDNGPDDPGVVPVWGIGVSSIGGGEPTLPSGIWTGWIYTIDVAGTDLEFELGDTDGSFTGITGASSTGCDKDDTNGSPKADFGWSYTFQQNQAGPLCTIGPYLALPASSDTFEDDHVPTGATGNADGVPDLFDFYKNPSGGLREMHAATYWFGGWSPSGFPPYASFYLGLYGPEGPDCSRADFNADTLVDVLDFLDFIDDFSNCENQPAPCGSVADADLTGDTIVDILDLLRFLDRWDPCN